MWCSVITDNGLSMFVPLVDSLNDFILQFFNKISNIIFINFQGMRLEVEPNLKYRESFAFTSIKALTHFINFESNFRNYL